MKKPLLVFCSGIAVMLLGMSFETVEREAGILNFDGAPAGHTGSPGDGKNCTFCHFGTPEVKTDIITSDIPQTGYVPGQTYTVTITLNSAGTTRFGWQLSPQNNSGDLLGSFGTAPAGSRFFGTGNKYFTHTMAGTNSADSKTVSIEWTAPNAGTGEVTFYGAFNISNADNNTTGDKIWTSSLTVSEEGTTSVKEASKAGFSVYATQNGELVVRELTVPVDRANLELYDLKGNRIRSWKNQEMGNGAWRARVDGLAEGVYVLRLRSGNYLISEKVHVRN